jgi:hypothetical protein
MLPLPQQSLINFDLESLSWKQLDHGSVAQTLLSDDWVLQRRPVRYLERWQTLIDNCLQRLQPETDPYFKAANYKIIEINKNHFWTLSSRLDHGEKRKLDLAIDLSIDQAWDIADVLLPIAIKTFDKINQKLPPNKIPKRLLRDDIRFIQRQKWSSDYVLVLLEQIHRISKNEIEQIPPEPKFEYVVGHGDPVHKNFVFNKDKHPQYCLVDWETITLLPKSSDPAHFFAHLLFKTEPENWLKKLEPYNQTVSEYLQTSQHIWLRSLGWFCLREYVVARSGVDRGYIDFETMLQGVLKLFRFES